MTIIEEYNQKRESLIKALREMDEEKVKPAHQLNMALAAYHRLQVSFDQKKKPEEKKISKEQNSTLFDITLCLADCRDDIHNDLSEMLKDEKSRAKPDFYLNMVYHIIRCLDISNKTDDADEGELWIDIDNQDIHDYLVCFIGLILRCDHEGIKSPEQIIDIIASDDLENPWHSCTDTQDTYRFVKQTYGLSSSDPRTFQRNIDLVAEDPECDEKGLAMMKDLVEPMPELLLVFIGSPFAGCKTDEEVASLRSRTDALLADPEHKDRMEKFFVLGITFWGLIPSGADMQSKLSTYESCLELFNAFYNCFLGPEQKEYYDALTEADKQVMRVTFIAGLFTSVLRNSMDEDSFLEQGFMYDPIAGNKK